MVVVEEEEERTREEVTEREAMVKADMEAGMEEVAMVEEATAAVVTEEGKIPSL